MIQRGLVLSSRKAEPVGKIRTMPEAVKLLYNVDGKEERQ
jgi:hypothetical protein